MNHLAILLCVTYTYDHSASTTIMNSIVLPVDTDGIHQGNTVTGDKSRFQIDVWVEEPTTITLRQSGIKLYFPLNNQNSLTISVAVGGQTARAYTAGAGTTVWCGGFSLSQRFDSSAAATGAGITLARGKNTLTIDWFAGSGTVPLSSMTGLIYLNYTSGKHASGDAVHNHSTAWQWFDYGQATLERSATPIAVPNIPESNYFINSVFAEFYGNVSGNSSVAFQLTGERGAGEWEAAGWENLGLSYIRGVSENGVYPSVGMSTDSWKRYPQDPNPGMDIETSRTARMRSVPNAPTTATLWVTYHAITFTFAGNVTGYGGAGTGITVNLYRSDTDVKVATATTTAGGAYTMTWYDNTVSVYATAREDSTHTGRSDTAVAT
jgi:hypothetical protein